MVGILRLSMRMKDVTFELDRSYLDALRRTAYSAIYYSMCISNYLLSSYAASPAFEWQRRKVVTIISKHRPKINHLWKLETLKLLEWRTNERHGETRRLHFVLFTCPKPYFGNLVSDFFGMLSLWLPVTAKSKRRRTKIWYALETFDKHKLKNQNSCEFESEAFRLLFGWILDDCRHQGRLSGDERKTVFCVMCFQWATSRFLRSAGPAAELEKGDYQWLLSVHFSDFFTQSIRSKF